jgi:hypothetical protein
MHHHKPLTFRDVFRFWLPLSLNWQMMAAEGPVIAAVVARLAAPEINLAAFGVAFAWALIIESPVIPLLSASAALCRDVPSFYQLRRFMWQLNGLSTVLQIVFVTPPVFNFITGTILNLPPDVAALAHQASIIMIPWSAAIGYRRFYQGVMIRSGMPRSVAVGTAVRMGAMLIAAVVLLSHGALPGASSACVILITAVLAEAIASRVMARPALRRLFSECTTEAAVMSHAALVRFYTPLTVTVLLGMGIQPLTTLALGHSALPVESLAVLPVVNSMVFFIGTSGNAMQETAIVLVGERLEQYRILQRFTWILGGALTVALAVIVLSPLGTFLFQSVLGLPGPLVPLALIAAQCAIAIPMLRTWEVFQRAVLIKAKSTALVTWVAVVEILAIAAVLYLLTQYYSVVGAFAAPLSLALAASLAVALLIKSFSWVERSTPSGS